MPLIAGVDSSTQSTKVEVRDLESGEIVAVGSAAHPPVTAPVTAPVSEQEPKSRWVAFDAAWSAAGSLAVEAIGVAGQQHGMVVLPDATGSVAGIRSDVTREQWARAAVDGVACGLLDGLDARSSLTDLDGSGSRIVLTGGGARSAALQQVIAGLVDRPVVVSSVAEAVATGAAVQAASVLEQVGSAVIQQRRGLGSGDLVEPAAAGLDARERYAAVRDR